MSDDKVATSL